MEEVRDSLLGKAGH